MTYEIDYVSCRQEGVKTVYQGESNRTLLDRANEHLANLRRQEDNSVLWKHWEHSHEDRKTAPDFLFHLKGVHRTPTERQLREAIAIQYCESDILLNSKTEYGRNSLLTLSTEEEDRRTGRQKEGGTLGGTNILPDRKRKRLESFREEDRKTSCGQRPSQRQTDSEKTGNGKEDRKTAVQRNGSKTGSIEKWIQRLSS